MKLTLFLSYSTADQALVRAFEAQLQPPLQAWVDEAELRAGEHFDVRLEQAIASESDFVVPFLSRNALTSTWVGRELAWALQREREGGGDVPFVLPILLEPVLDDADFPPSLRTRHHLSFFDHSEAGTRRAAQELGQAVFVLLARYFMRSRPSGPRALVEELERSLAKYKECTYRLTAAMGDSVAVLGRDQGAANVLVEAVTTYSQFAKAFVAELPLYAQRIGARWGKNLGDETHALARFIEEDVYRGPVFELNNARANINLVGTEEVTADEIAAMNRKKDRALKKAEAAAEDMMRRAGDLIAKLRREL